MTAVTPSVTVGPSATVISSTVIGEVSIDYGRRSPNEETQPTTATIELLNPISAEVKLGATIKVYAGNLRYSGVIEAIIAGPYTTSVHCTSGAYQQLQRATSPKGFYVTGDYSGTGFGAIMNGVISIVQAQLGWTSIPAAATATDSAMPINMGPFPVGSSFAGTGNLYTGSAWEFLKAFGQNDPLGYWFQYPWNDTIYYADSRYRSGLNTWTIDPALVEKDWTVTYAATDLLNSYSVNYYTGWNYGLTEIPATTTTTITDANSQASYGVFQESVSTFYVVKDEADRMAQMAISGRRVPRPVLSSMVVDVRRADFTTTSNLLVTSCGTMYTFPVSTWSTLIPNLPLYMIVEGYRETITSNTHTIELYFSDWRITWARQLWNEVNPTPTYAGMSATTTYDDLLGVWI